MKVNDKVKDSTTIPKGKVISEETDKNRKESNKKEDNSDKKVINSKQSTVLDKKDKGKQEVDLKCDMCEYSSKKINILNKHINTKHSDHTCKIYYKEFPNSMDALVHNATDYTKTLWRIFQSKMCRM